MSKYLKKPTATAASPGSSFANGASSPSPTRFNGAGSISGLDYGSDAPNSFRSTPLRGSSTAIRGTSALERASMYLNTRARPLSIGATSPPTHRIDRTNAMRSTHSSRSSSRSSAHSSLRRTKPLLDRRTASPAAVVVDDTDSSISLAASEIPSDTSMVLHNPPKIRSPTRPHPTSAAAILDRFRKPDKSPTPSVSTASRKAGPAPASVAVPNEPSKDLVSDFSAFLNLMSDTSGVAKESVRSAVDKSIEGQSRSAVEILSSMRQPQQSSAIVSSVQVSTRQSGASSVPSSLHSSGASARGKQSSAVASAISGEHSRAETSFGDVTSVIEEEGSDASAISESVVSSIASAASSDGSSRGFHVVSDASGSRSAVPSRVSSVRSRSSASSAATSARSEATRSVATPEYSDDDESAAGEYEDDFEPSAATSPVKSSLVIPLPAPAAKTLTPLPLATPATALAATPAVSHVPLPREPTPVARQSDSSPANVGGRSRTSTKATDDDAQSSAIYTPLPPSTPSLCSTSSRAPSTGSRRSHRTPALSAAPASPTAPTELAPSTSNAVGRPDLAPPAANESRKSKPVPQASRPPAQVAPVVDPIAKMATSRPDSALPVEAHGALVAPQGPRPPAQAAPVVDPFAQIVFPRRKPSRPTPPMPDSAQFPHATDLSSPPTQPAFSAVVLPGTPSARERRDSGSTRLDTSRSRRDSLPGTTRIPPPTEPEHDAFGAAPRYQVPTPRAHANEGASAPDRASGTSQHPAQPFAALPRAPARPPPASRPPAFDPTASNQYAPLVDMMQHLSTAIQTLSTPLSTPSPPRPLTADSGISAPATCACAHNDKARTYAFNQLLLAQVHLVQHLMSVTAPPGVTGSGFRYTTLEDTREYLRRHRRPPLSMDEALAQVRWEEERDAELARGSLSVAAEVKGRT